MAKAGWTQGTHPTGRRPRLLTLLVCVGLGACSGITPASDDDPRLVPGANGMSWSSPSQGPTGSSGDVGGSLVRLGDDLRSRGNLGGAIAFYQQAAARSKDADVLIKLGRVFGEVGAHDRAIGAFREALVREPDNGDALLGLGGALLNTGQIEDCITVLQQALDSAREPRRYRALGAALDMAGRHEQAIQTYDAGLAEAPADLDLRSNLALSLALHGEPDRAIQIMRDVATAPSATGQHHRILVLVLALTGRETEALAIGQNLVGAGPTQLILAQAANAMQLADATERTRAIGTTQTSVSVPRPAGSSG